MSLLLKSNIPTMLPSPSIPQRSTVLGVWGQKYLFRLVCIRKGNDHPDDIEVNESSTGREGTRQDCSLAPGHLDTARALGHFQGHCDTCRERNNLVLGGSFSNSPVSIMASHYIQSRAVNTLTECSNQRMTHRSLSQNKKVRRSLLYI